MFVSIKIKKITLIIVSVALVIVITLGVTVPPVVKAEIKKMGSVEVPIIMYHSIVKDESMWNDYVLSPVDLEKDIIWLKKHGYRTVFVSDLINYVNGTGELPEKPVILSFDDGCYNNFYYVYPLLKKYDVKATMSVVGSYSEFACEEASPSPVYSYLDWEDINKMRKSGLVEIANHSYDLHSLDDRQGVKMKSNETYDDYRHVFLTDTFRTQDLLEEFCGFTPIVYTYPYGFTCEAAERLVKNSGFQASLGVEEKLNYVEQGNKDCLYNLCRFNRPAFISTEDFMEKYKIN